MNAVDLAPLLAHVQPGQRILEPLRPKGKGWERFEVSAIVKQHAYVAECWYHRVNELQVISAIEVVSQKAGVDPATPHYHVSITKLRYRDRLRRCSSADARWVLREFGAEGALEDNHVPHGIARNFFRPVKENDIGKECACTETEPKIVEDKGDYIWRPA